MRLFFSLRRFLFSNPATAVTPFPTLGGRIRCPRCQAKSKRSQQQCISSAIRGKRHGKVHGGRAKAIARSFAITKVISAWIYLGPTSNGLRYRCHREKTSMEQQACRRRMCGKFDNHHLSLHVHKEDLAMASYGRQDAFIGIFNSYLTP